MEVVATLLRNCRIQRRSLVLRALNMARQPASFRIAGNCIAAALLAWAAVAAAPLWAQQPDAPQAKAQGQGDQTALANRMTQLEEQIVDLQVVIGTLQSLVRQQNAPGDYQQAPASEAILNQGNQLSLPPSSGGSEVGTRLTVIETQIQALTGQIEQLSQRLQQLQSGGTGSFSMGEGSQPPADPPADPPDDNLGRLMR